MSEQQAEEKGKKIDEAGSSSEVVERFMGLCKSVMGLWNDSVGLLNVWSSINHKISTFTGPST